MKLNKEMWRKQLNMLEGNKKINHFNFIVKEKLLIDIWLNSLDLLIEKKKLRYQMEEIQDKREE